jgi:hypothetical protein
MDLIREIEPIAQEPSRLEHACPDRIVFRLVHILASGIELRKKILN